jgi:hypothetical protein
MIPPSTKTSGSEGFHLLGITFGSKYVGAAEEASVA